VSVSLSPSPLFPLESVPASWGVFDCQRLASAAEMAACSAHCGECGVHMAAKVGGGVVQGTVVGRRSSASEAWSWSCVLCRSCEVAHSVADGY
jgi:hypothetical protein